MTERWTFVHEVRIVCKQWLNQSTGSRGELRCREEKVISWWIQGDWWLKLPGWAGCRECVWVWWLCLHSGSLSAKSAHLKWVCHYIFICPIPLTWNCPRADSLSKKGFVFRVGLKTLKRQQEHKKKSHLFFLTWHPRWNVYPTNASSKEPVESVCEGWINLEGGWINPLSVTSMQIEQTCYCWLSCVAQDFLFVQEGHSHTTLPRGLLLCSLLCLSKLLPKTVRSKVKTWWAPKKNANTFKTCHIRPLFKKELKDEGQISLHKLKRNFFIIIFFLFCNFQVVS